MSDSGWIASSSISSGSVGHGLGARHGRRRGRPRVPFRSLLSSALSPASSVSAARVPSLRRRSPIQAPLRPCRSLARPLGRRSLAAKVQRRDWRHSWSAMSFSSCWLQKLSIAVANQSAIGALRRTTVCTRQRVLGGVGESEDGGYESVVLERAVM